MTKTIDPAPATSGPSPYLTQPLRSEQQARQEAHSRLSEQLRASVKALDPRDTDYSREGVFQTHNCYRCKSGELPCVKGKGRERECDTLHARND